MFRPVVLALAVPAGLLAGILGWLAAGGGAVAARLEPVETQLAAIRPGRAAGAASAPAVDVASLVGSPIFPMTTGPGAVREPAVRVDGIVRTRARRAALVSINDRPAEWLAVGEEREGVTLQDVGASKIVVDTVFGPQTVGLGERIPANGAAATASASAPPVEQTIVDMPPAGFRGPPPPASAPRTP